MKLNPTMYTTDNVCFKNKPIFIKSVLVFFFLKKNKKQSENKFISHYAHVLHTTKVITYSAVNQHFKVLNDNIFIYLFLETQSQFKINQFQSL